MALILLDRDGVINEDRKDYVKSIAEFRFLPGVRETMADMKRRGWKMAIVTNQSCIGKNIISEAQLREIHNHMQAELRKSGAEADAIYFAPDHPDHASLRRKPGPGMLIEAMRDFGAHPENSFMIGDALRDMIAAQKAGCHRYLIENGEPVPPELQPLTLVKDLTDAARRIAAITA